MEWYERGTPKSHIAAEFGKETLNIALDKRGYMPEML